MNVGRISSLAGVATLGMTNQIIASATNFGLTIYLVRTLPPEQFGLWGLGFATVLLILGLANGMLLTQMVVGLPRRAVADRGVFMGSILSGTVLAGLLVTGLALAAAAILHFYHLSASDTVALTLATGFASASVILLNFFIRQAFSIAREATAVVLNLVLLAGVVLLVNAMHDPLEGIGAARAMLLYGLAHLIAALFGMVLLPASSRRLHLASVKADLREAWQQGRWAMGGVWVSWGQSQAYVFLTPLLFGLAGLGAVNAARMMVAPLIMLMPAIAQVALPRFSRMQVDRADAMFRAGWRLSQMLLIGAALYGIAIAIGYDTFSNLLLGEVRADLFWITMAWCLMAMLSLIRQIATVMMQSARQFYMLFRYEAMVLVATVSGIWLLSGPLGLSAGVLATSVGECLIAVLVWRYFRSLQSSGGVPLKAGVGSRAAIQR